MASIVFVVYLAISLRVLIKYSRFIVRQNLAQLILWNILNAFWVACYALLTQDIESLWLTYTLILLHSGLFIWLQLTLFSIKKIVIYLDPSNDSVVKV